jgi:hypothetical protein
MALSFVSEPLEALDGSFDTGLMAQGEPGLPHRFRWRAREWNVAEILETGKRHGDCRNGSGERYVRQHRYRVRLAEGPVMTICFQRTVGKGKRGPRWWVYAVEGEMAA